jgi:hypothetical protein
MGRPVWINGHEQRDRADKWKGALDAANTSGCRKSTAMINRKVARMDA